MTSSFIRTVVAQTVADQRIFWRNTSLMLFTFLIPMVLLVAVVIADQGLVSFALVLVLVIAANAFQGLGIQLAMHRDQGVLKGLIAASMAPATYVVGKTISVLVIIVAEILLVLAVAAALTSFGLPNDPLAFLWMVILGTFNCVALSFAVTSVVSNSDAAPAVVSVAYFALIAIMGVPIWVDSLSDGLLVTFQWLPLGALLQGLVGTWSGQATSVSGLEVLANLMLWTVLAGLFAARKFRWEPRESLT